MSEAEVDEHNKRDLWADGIAHLDAARNSLDNAVVAFEDLANTYDVEEAQSCADEATTAFDAVEKQLDDAKRAQRQ